MIIQREQLRQFINTLDNSLDYNRTLDKLLATNLVWFMQKLDEKDMKNAKHLHNKKS